MSAFLVMAAAAVFSAQLVVDGTYCPALNRTGEPRFLEEPAKIEYGFQEHSKPLYCCAAGVEKVVWYRWQANGWKNYSSPDNTFDLQEYGQVLRIYSLSVSDNTSFKCELEKNSEPVKANVVTLTVIICDKLGKGPVPTDPFPKNQTIDDFGESLTFECTGYFGCDSASAQIVEWQVKGQWKNISLVDNRYVTKNTRLKFNTTQKSTLTINSVKPVDLERTFVCQIASPQMIKGQTSLEVKIFKNKKLSLTKVILICAGVVVAAIIMIGAILYTVNRLYGPQIRVYMASRSILFQQRIVKDENIKHNVFIYHAADDIAKAKEIQKHLEEKDLHTSMCDDIPGNAMQMKALEDKISQSAMVLFLYSQNLRDDLFANLILQSLIYNSQGKNILFIEIDSYDPVEVMNWNKEAEKRKNKEKLANSIELSNDELQVDGNNVEIKSKGGDTPDLRFWKALPRFKFPAENVSDRKQKNFWCSVRNRIPLLEHQIKSKKRPASKSSNSSHGGCERQLSSRPLLESPVPSPSYVECPSNQISPNSNEVFSYERQNSDDPVPCRSKPVVINVDVHSNGQTLDNNAYAEEYDRDNPIGAYQDSNVRDNMIGLNNETSGNRCLSAQSSQSDRSELEIFSVSGEEPHAPMNETGDRFREMGNGQVTDITGRKFGGGSGNSQLPNLQTHNGNLHVDIDKSCSSPESGYTSLSPQRLDDVDQWEGKKQLSNINMQGEQVQTA